MLYSKGFYPCSRDDFPKICLSGVFFLLVISSALKGVIESGLGGRQKLIKSAASKLTRQVFKVTLKYAFREIL